MSEGVELEAGGVYDAEGDVVLVTRVAPDGGFDYLWLVARDARPDWQRLEFPGRSDALVRPQAAVFRRAATRIA